MSVFSASVSRYSILRSPLLRSRHPRSSFSRLLSTPPSPPSPAQRLLRRSRVVLKYTTYLAFSSVLGIVIVGSCIFIHDAFTYTDQHVDRVPVSPLALHPKRGGPRNLPVASVLVSDVEDAVAEKIKDKPRLVIVGGGWGVRLY